MNAREFRSQRSLIGRLIEADRGFSGTAAEPPRRVGATHHGGQSWPAQLPSASSVPNRSLGRPAGRRGTGGYVTGEGRVGVVSKI